MGYLWVGHYDTWKLDCLQKLIEKNHGLVFLPGHNCARDYRDTAESFQTVAIHSKELHDAVVAIKVNSNVRFSWDIQFLCKALGVPIPFLLVSGKKEYRLFTHLLHQMGGFDDEKLAIKWCEFVDGESVFPELPAYLREYHKHWQQNQRIQDAVKNMKSEVELLKAVNKQHTPAELIPTGVALLTGGAALESSIFSVSDGVEESMVAATNGNGMLAWLGVHFPPMIPWPMQHALHPPCSTVFVGTEATGTNYYNISTMYGSKKKKIGKRGSDNVEKRCKRRCGRCLAFAGLNAESCPSSSKCTRCIYFDDHGKPT